VTTSGSVASPVFGAGVMVRKRWNDPVPSAVQTQEPKGVAAVEGGGWPDDN
jgi:hypothetical protein